MVCNGLETLTDNTIKGILSFPTSCDYYFYGKIMGAFFIILSFILYYRDRTDKLVLKPDMLSCMGVSAIATMIISLFMTFLNMVQPDVFIEIIVVGMIFVSIWLIKK